jgi:hypothetical protein
MSDLCEVVITAPSAGSPLLFSTTLHPRRSRRIPLLQSRPADVCRIHAETARIHGNRPGQQLVVMSRNGTETSRC